MNSIESYVSCPFDDTHRIIKGRLQTHLYKCHRHYPKGTKMQCPFDATHMLDPQEYEHHLEVCTTSGNVKCYQNELGAQTKVGTVSLQEVCALQAYVMDEDWSGNNPTYDPIAASEEKDVVRMAVGLSKAQKKKYKQQERDRISSIENSSCNTSTTSNSTLQRSVDFEKPLRAPKKAAKAMTYSENDASADLISMLTNISIDSSKNSLSTKNDFTKKNNSSKSMNSSNESCSKENTSKINKENISKTSNCNNLNQENCKETSTEKDTACKDSNKQNKVTLGNGFTLNPRMAAKFYGEARKISTGRGFTMAYQYLNNSLKSGEGKDNSKELSSARGYGED